MMHGHVREVFVAIVCALQAFSFDNEAIVQEVLRAGENLVFPLDRTMPPGSAQLAVGERGSRPNNDDRFLWIIQSTGFGVSIVNKFGFSCFTRSLLSVTLQGHEDCAWT